MASPQDGVPRAATGTDAAEWTATDCSDIRLPFFLPGNPPPASSWRTLDGIASGSPHDEPHSGFASLAAAHILGAATPGVRRGDTGRRLGTSMWTLAVGPPNPGADWRQSMSDGIRRAPHVIHTRILFFLFFLSREEGNVCETSPNFIALLAYEVRSTCYLQSTENGDSSGKMEPKSALWGDTSRADDPAHSPLASA